LTYAANKGSHASAVGYVYSGKKTAAEKLGAFLFLDNITAGGTITTTKVAITRRQSIVHRRLDHWRILQKPRCLIIVLEIATKK
jgi:hypothetical protein